MTGYIIGQSIIRIMAIPGNIFVSLGTDGEVSHQQEEEIEAPNIVAAFFYACTQSAEEALALLKHTAGDLAKAVREQIKILKNNDHPVNHNAVVTPTSNLTLFHKKAS